MANIEVEKVFKSELNSLIDTKNSVVKLTGSSRVTVNANSSCVVSGKFATETIYSKPPLILYTIQSADPDCFNIQHYLSDITTNGFKISLQNTSKINKDIIINYKIAPF
jgi:hypothetical protein